MAKLTDITRDLVLAQNEYEIFEDEGLQERINELVYERYRKKMVYISSIKILNKK